MDRRSRPLDARPRCFFLERDGRSVARVWFEGLPDYSSPGAPLAATLALDAEGLVRATDLDLFLHGVETAQITVGSGKSRRVVVQKAPFLELGTSFHDSLHFQDSDHIGPGTFRFPFRFDLPATSPPSLATSELPRTRGRFEQRPDGMYVEYELEARLKVPWWVDPLDREVVPTFSPRRVLGAVAPFATAAGPDRPSVQLHVDPVMILPGSVVTGGFSVENPYLKELPQLTISFLRLVEYRAQGYTSTREGPEYSTSIPLGPRAPQYQGTFQVPIPNTANATGPNTGALYRTYWVARIDLDVSFGFNVKMDAVFTPA